MTEKLTYTEDDGGGGRALVDLDHGEDLRHLAIAGPGIEKARGCQQDPVNTWSRDISVTFRDT